MTARESFEKWADLAMVEFQAHGRSHRFKVLQDIALGHYGRIPRPERYMSDRRAT